MVWLPLRFASSSIDDGDEDENSNEDEDEDEHEDEAEVEVEDEDENEEDDEDEDVAEVRERVNELYVKLNLRFWIRGTGAVLRGVDRMG